MNKRFFKKAIKVVPLSQEVAEGRAVAHSRLSKKYSDKGLIASARYHAELAAFIHKQRREPDSKQRKAIFAKSQTSATAPFRKGSGKGYDVFPPGDKSGPKIFEGIAIVVGPDKWSMRFSSMEEAIRYVRVNNIGDLPVRVHKKP